VSDVLAIISDCTPLDWHDWEQYDHFTFSTACLDLFSLLYNTQQCLVYFTLNWLFAPIQGLMLVYVGEQCSSIYQMHDSSPIAINLDAIAPDIRSCICSANMVPDEDPAMLTTSLFVKSSPE